MHNSSPYRMLEEGRHDYWYTKWKNNQHDHLNFQRKRDTKYPRLLVSPPPSTAAVRYGCHGRNNVIKVTTWQYYTDSTCALLSIICRSQAAEFLLLLLFVILATGPSCCLLPETICHFKKKNPSERRISN